MNNKRVPNLAQRVFGTLWLLLALVIFVYSYGFVDFNLTISSHPIVMNFISWTQNLAMFHRSTSIYVYLLSIVIMFALYIGVMINWFNGKIVHFPWKFITILAIIFALSYPFLSSDVFKYLFAGREVVLYHTNPKLVSPQVFEGDTWLRFMRWIHTPSPYGDVMTALSTSYYILGFGKFVPILYLFKLDQVFWYLLSIYLIGKLAGKRAVIAQLFFALNPLIILEWLINSHNDAPMISLLLLSFYLLSKKKTIYSLISLILSIGIKYVTIIFLPIIFFYKKLTHSTIIYYSLIVLAIAPLLYNYQTQYQPWYVTWLVPLAALSGSTMIMTLIGAYCLGALLRYIPVILYGVWLGTPLYFAILTFLPPIIVATYYLGSYILRHLSKKQL